jgi:O-methyltransferase involved in polyketide biosynthesis
MSRLDDSPSARISPTAHYTGQTWVRAGLAPRSFATREGRSMHALLAPVSRGLAPLVGGATLETMLLQRHHAIDALLWDAIDRGAVGQVVEIAAGLSARGWRTMRREKRPAAYLECDLAGMAARKAKLLQSAGPVAPGHRVLVIDALRDDGPESLDAIVAELDPSAPVAFVTEGLLNYFSSEQVAGLWSRIARAGRRFPSALYLAELHTRRDTDRYALARAFRAGLGVFARGRVTIHHETKADARDAALASGFDGATVHDVLDVTAGRGLDVPVTRARLLHVLEAWTTPRDKGILTGPEAP